MRFLLRVAFWLGIVLVLLPTGGSKQAPPASAQGSEITAMEAASAAVATVSDMRHFCARQPDACAVGAQAAVAIGQRAQAGAKMLYELLNEKFAAHDNAATSANRTTSPHAAKSSQDTLTPADLAPPWRGPPNRKEAQNRRAV
jgi:hypothetical protein